MHECQTLHFARRVVGWAMSARNDTALVEAALDMAVAQRRPLPELIHHTDQGQTYAAGSYRQRLQFELIDQKVFATREPARTAIFEFIEVFCNRLRAHQTLNYKAPPS